MTLRDHLQTIYDERGHLTPDLVVDLARPKSHPLHGHVFDRAPRDAAEAWYRHRAHELIQGVKIAYKATPTGPDRRIRAFHCVRTEGGHVYEPAEKVAADPFLREMLLRDMEREWNQLRDRYSEFSEFAQLISRSLEAMAA